MTKEEVLTWFTNDCIDFLERLNYSEEDGTYTHQEKSLAISFDGPDMIAIDPKGNTENLPVNKYALYGFLVWHHQILPTIDTL